MFGFAAFAATPFAALLNTQIIVTVAESVTPNDTQSTQVAFVITTAESVTLTDTQNVIVAFAPQVAELLTLIELISIQSNLVGYTAETIIFTDTRIQRGWIKINDSQNANWTNIGNNQTPGWVDINNYQG
jgi:hypothetical protein